MTKSKKIKINREKSWHWLLGLGVLFTLLGLLGISQAVGVTLVSILFLGFIIMVAGIAQLIDVFKSKRWQASTWHALVACFYIIAGSLVVADPLLASTLITLLIAWIFIFIGITRFVMALTLKSTTPGWFFFCLSALAAIVLGTLILIQWPLNSLWVIGLLISIELIISGWTYIFIAFAIRQK